MEHPQCTCGRLVMPGLQMLIHRGTLELHLKGRLTLALEERNDWTMSIFVSGEEAVYMSLRPSESATYNVTQSKNTALTVSTCDDTGMWVVSRVTAASRLQMPQSRSCTASPAQPQAMKHLLYSTTCLKLLPRPLHTSFSCCHEQLTPPATDVTTRAWKENIPSII
ncbi:hypothetical protein PAMP_010120 [Pampus punctatissimus]